MMLCYISYVLSFKPEKFSYVVDFDMKLVTSHNQKRTGVFKHILLFTVCLHKHVPTLRSERVNPLHI